tara:strand:- start:58 stop:183 length:126 start_codon:yes stop_codon:yes gene_type:complete
VEKANNTAIKDKGITDHDIVLAKAWDVNSIPWMSFPVGFGA